jgi:hypothetical protein
VTTAFVYFSVHYIAVIKSRIAMANAALNKKTLFTTKVDLNLRNRLVKCYFGAQLSMVLKIGHFGQQARNTWRVLECGAREEWRRSVGLTV